MRLAPYLSLIVLASVSQAGSLALSDAPHLQKAFQWLEKSPSGKAILQTASEMKIPVLEGKVSKTEMTATRTSDGKSEKLDFSTQVIIARDKDAVFQALDLAHELTHATHPNTNPFDPKLDAQEYVRHGIEGSGGEAQAILQECKVGKELLGYFDEEETAKLVTARCQFVWKNENDDQKWKRSFYQLGQHYHAFLQMISKLQIEPTQKNAWAKSVEQRSPMFSSAVTHKPYPLALLEEYVQITQKICEKSLAKAENSTPSRQIAGVSEVLHALTDRCQSVQNIP